MILITWVTGGFVPSVNFFRTSFASGFPDGKGCSGEDDYSDVEVITPQILINIRPVVAP